MKDISEMTIKEIEKMTQNINKEIDEELENRLKKKPNFKNPIDKFTSVDDLLRQLIPLQKELIEQMYISNQLSWATLKKSSDGGFISPYPNGDKPIILGRDDDYKTLVKHMANMKVSGSEKIFELNGSGFLAECKFQSSNATANNKAYGVRIVSDNSIVYQDTWANFENRSFYETDMSCWEDAVRGYYILAFKNMAFAKKLSIEVYGATATTFSNIYLKYHLKVV